MFRSKFSSLKSRTTGFSLIEALLALTITALAGSVLLLSVDTSLDTTTQAVERTIADGIAQQVLDEILTKRYVGAGESPLTTTLGPTATEQLGEGTINFDDIDDYNGFTAQPMKGPWGQTLGTGDDNGGQRPINFRVPSSYFQSWRETVTVYYIDPNDHTVKSTTPLTGAVSAAIGSPTRSVISPTSSRAFTI